MSTWKSSPEFRRLLELSGEQINSAEWLTDAEASIDFVRKNICADRIVLYASLPHVLIHALLAPRTQLKEPKLRELDDGFVPIDATWGIDYSIMGGRRNRVYLAPPLSPHNAALKGGEKLIFRRHWPGTETVTTEVSQRFIHALDVHFVEERAAYCRIDENGDIENVIEIIDEPSDRFGESVIIVTIKAVDLYDYSAVAGMGLVFFYDFTRYIPGYFSGWSNVERIEKRSTEHAYTGGILEGTGSFIHGWQIALPKVTRSDVLRKLRGESDSKKRRYSDFLALNIRTMDLVDVSCNPSQLSNYFETDSDLPLEMSPAFFRSEVLHKYKADPEKYELNERSIRCRGAWYLKTYDVNEANQVHTYLRYLSDLPYQEQLYWRSFNEMPKAPLSRRAFTTDFKGEIYADYDPLVAVKAATERLDEAAPEWWSARGQDLRKVVHYPVTTSQAEWAEAILSLDQLIVEGFRVKSLRKRACSLGADVDTEWKSLKLLEVCLEHSGFSKDEARALIKPLRDVHELRVITKGHSAPNKKAGATSKALRVHGSFREHLKHLAAEIDRALTTVTLVLSPVSS